MPELPGGVRVATSSSRRLLYSISVTRGLSIRVLDYHPPGGKPRSIGVLAYCPQTDSLHVFFRNLDHIVDECDREYLQEMSATITNLSAEMDRSTLFAMLDQSLSNLIRIGYQADQVQIADDDINAALSEVLRGHDCGE
jgi:hypothetical protein